MMVPPPSAARPTCSPSRAKSADKIEGASSINLGLSGKRMQAEILTRWPCGSDTLVRQRLAALGTVVSAPLVTPRLSKRIKVKDVGHTVSDPQVHTQGCKFIRFSSA